MAKPLFHRLAESSLLIASLSMAAAGCGTEDLFLGGSDKDDGYPSDFAPTEESREPMDARNDPRLWRTAFEYNWDVLSANQSLAQGASEILPWPDTYWPMVEDGYNARWNGDKLSPVELYDQAFNGWTPAGNFLELKPFTGPRTAYDAAYYDGLGKAATWAHERGGNYQSRQVWKADGTLTSAYAQCDTDGDNHFDSDAPKNKCDLDGDGEVGSGDEMGGLEGWWGHCHAWAPAAFTYPEPSRSVTRNGVTFEVADLKALAESTMEGGDSVFIGARCNARDIERDEYGRIVDSQKECRDTNAGAFHIITVNVVGVMKKSYVADVTENFAVWNQPIRDYEILEQTEITGPQAMEKLGRTGEYSFNDNAKRFAYVSMRWRYVVEGSAGTRPLVPSIDSYTRTRNFEYILEMSQDGTIIGGEWIEAEIPDFLWAPVGEGTDVRDFGTVIKADEVRSLIAEASDQEEPSDPPAPGPALTCDDTVALEPGTPFKGATDGASEYEASCAGDARSPEDIYKVVVTEPSKVVVRVDAEYDCAVYLRSACDDQGSELACNDDESSGNYNASRVEKDLDPGTYYVFVDGYDSDSKGRYEVSLEMTPL